MHYPFQNWFSSSTETGPVTQRVTPAFWTPQPHLPGKPRSVLTSEWGYGHMADDHLLQPPEGDPRVLYPLFRWMRDRIPDVSAGVWAWVRLCHTPLDHHVATAPGESAEGVNDLLSQLDRTLYGPRGEQNRGIESLMQAFFLSIFTYGAFAGEVVVRPGGKGLNRFVVIDPATIRFRLDPETGDRTPCQLTPDNRLIRLNEASFFYFGLDTDGLSPYGRSPLMALPLVIQAQQQLLEDMQQTQRNAGYPLLHFQITPSTREPGESNHDYMKRLNKEMDDVRSAVAERRPEHNLVTYDTVQVNYLSSSGKSMQWTESLQAISEQVVSALHLAPFMLGRNWGTTQSWGTAQYQLITNNARTVQNGAGRLADWLRNLHLALCGSSSRVEHRFERHHLLDLADRARAFQDFTSAIIRLTENNLLDEADARQRLDSLFRYW